MFYVKVWTLFQSLQCHPSVLHLLSLLNLNPSAQGRLTIVEKVKFLDMLKEGRTYTAVGRHFGLNESTVHYLSIIPAISVCLSVCLWPLFLDNHWSDLIETCQVYCWGPVDVSFQGLILIGQVVPKLWPFIYQTNDRTRCYDVTILLFFCTYGHILVF